MTPPTRFTGLILQHATLETALDATPFTLLAAPGAGLTRRVVALAVSSAIPAGSQTIYVLSDATEIYKVTVPAGTVVTLPIDPHHPWSTGNHALAVMTLTDYLTHFNAAYYLDAE